jgi:hypothetical protein
MHTAPPGGEDGQTLNNRSIWPISKREKKSKEKRGENWKPSATKNRCNQQRRPASSRQRSPRPRLPCRIPNATPLKSNGRHEQDHEQKPNIRLSQRLKKMTHGPDLQRIHILLTVKRPHMQKNT